MWYSIDFHKQTIKNDVPLATVTKLKTLPCQQICDFKIQKSLDIPETFTVESELLVNDQKSMTKSPTYTSLLSSSLVASEIQDNSSKVK